MLNKAGAVQVVVCCALSLFLHGRPASGADGNAVASEEDLKAKTIQAHFDRGWALLGQMHKDLSVLDEALSVYQEVLKMDPGNADAYWKLAETTFKIAVEKKTPEESRVLFEKAVEYAQRSLSLDPESPEAHYWIGVSSTKLAEMAGIVSAVGLVRTARRELEKTVVIAPDNRFAALAQAVLAAIFTESPWPMRDLDKAEAVALDAVGKDPNLTLASEKLARVYIKQKRYGKARKELNRGLAIAQPTYIWDAELYDWPAERTLLKEIAGKK